jgi:SSS family solute:Na+ symporter
MIFAVQVTSADPAAWIPLLVLVIYLTVLLGLGWLGYRRSTGGEEDYYLAGRNQGWIVSSFTIMATFFSSFALLGAPGMVYREGVVFALVSLNVPVAGFCVYLFGDRIRRIGRQHGFVTQADMFCAHYDSQIVLRLLVSLVGFLFVMPYVMMQLKAGGELAAVMFPNYEYGFEIGAIVLSVITALYIMIGGMRSVAWTDALQCLLLTAGMIAAGAALITSFGGLASFHAAVATLPDSSLTVPGNTGFWRVPTLFTVCLLMPIGGIIQPAQWMRFYSARDASTLRRSALIFIVLLTGCFLFGIMLVGLGGQALYPLEFSEGSVAPHNAVGSFDQILVTVIRDKLPEMLGPGLGFTMASLMIVAIMAAAMSTADSNLHALSALFTRDIYDRFIRPSATEHERVWVGRLVIIAATCASLGLVIIGSHPESSLFGFMQMIVDLALFAVAFSVQLLPMTIDTLFVRRGTKLGAIVGLMAGLVVAFCFTALFPLFVAVANGADGQGPLAVVLDWVTAAKNVLPIHATAWGLIPNALLFAVLSVRAGQRRARAMREKPAPI